MERDVFMNRYLLATLILIFIFLISSILTYWGTYSWQYMKNLAVTEVPWRNHNDIAGDEKVTSTMPFILFESDTTPPQWRKQGQNNSKPLQGEAVQLFAQAFLI